MRIKDRNTILEEFPYWPANARRLNIQSLMLMSRWQPAAVVINFVWVESRGQKVRRREASRVLFEAVLPGYERQPLLDVPRYDFIWQTAYRFITPLEFPKDTRIHCVAHFDNSTNNPNNPDPTKTMRWGEQA